MVAESNVRIRGTSEGLIVSLGTGDWPDLLAELDARLGQTPDFFRGGRVAVDVGRRLLEVEEIQTLGELLSQHGVTLWAVWSETAETQQAAQFLGLESVRPLTEERPQPARPRESSQPSAEYALVVRGPLRSGQRIRHEGTVVVLGDVHPGAEVACTGNIIVWGRLRGTAHAGMWGDDTAVVCALHFAPLQVRIGHRLAQGDNSTTPNVPEVARVIDNAIVVEPWTEFRWRKQ